MIYLSGVIRHDLLGKRPDLGFLVTPRMGNIFDLSAGPWAADNGCFSAGSSFDMGVYLDFLAARRHAAATCLFAPAPDVVGDADATWRRSEKALRQIRDAGFKAALVGQDGLEDPPWDAFDALFIGGSTAWKLSHIARELAAKAKARGKHVHMGRVNSETRLRTAALWGCDSVDGTFLAFGPDKNTPRLLGWLDRLNKQPQLAFAHLPRKITGAYMSDVMSQMPRYQSHKKVWALQVHSAQPDENGALLRFSDEGFADRVVPSAVVSRYFPQPGDYLVQYEDGYLSISPQKAFEDGYTRV